MDNVITPSDSLSETRSRSNAEMAKEEISRMCLTILDDLEAGNINSLPMNERTLRRGANGESIDDKTVRTISCLYYKTEDFQKLVEVVPTFLKNTIENANNRLTHQGDVSYEIARNPELVQLWNSCSGFGLNKKAGEEMFPGKFDTLIKILEEHKLVTKSVFDAGNWIMNGDMIKDREDFVYHYDQMFSLTKETLNDQKNGKVIQFCSAMRQADYDELTQGIVSFFYDFVQKKSISKEREDSSFFGNDIVKFNFQASLCELARLTNEVSNAIH